MEVVRALVVREVHNIQLPPAQQEAIESTLTRPSGSAGRPRNPSPSGGKRSGRSHRESLEGQRQEGGEPGRVRKRSRHIELPTRGRLNRQRQLLTTQTIT